MSLLTEPSTKHDSRHFGLVRGRNVAIVATAKKLPGTLGDERLDDIAKDDVTDGDRRAEDGGQKKIQTADDR